VAATRPRVHCVMNLSGTTILVWHFKNNVEKQKLRQTMSICTATIIYFEIYMYLRAQFGVSLHKSEPPIGDILPDVNLGSEISKAERTIRVKRHAI
jgi:hypothetical protein